MMIRTQRRERERERSVIVKSTFQLHMIHVVTYIITCFLFVTLLTNLSDP